MPLVACGGSIESRSGPDGLKTVTGGIEAIAEAASALVGCRTRLERFAVRPSYTFAVLDLLELARVAAAVAGSVRPVVTFGTDLMEEAAFVLDLLPPEPGVVLTGATGDASLGSDGVPNLAGALRVAAWDGLVPGCGYAAFAGAVRLGRDIIEASGSGDLFANGAEPVARWDDRGLRATSRPDWRPLPRPAVPAAPAPVIVLEAHAALSEPPELQCPAVVVVRCFGSGNMPPVLAEALERRLAQHLPVVLCSTSPGVPLRRVSAESGGGARLLDRGALSAGSLTPRKAAVLSSIVFGDESANGAMVFAEIVAAIEGQSDS